MRYSAILGNMSLPTSSFASALPPDDHQRTARQAARIDGARVRELALAAGFPSDEALARAAGLSYGYLWQCLAGRRAAGPKVLAGLLRAMPGATLDDLVASAGQGGAAVSA